MTAHGSMAATTQVRLGPPPRKGEGAASATAFPRKGGGATLLQAVPVRGAGALVVGRLGWVLVGAGPLPDALGQLARGGLALDQVLERSQLQAPGDQLLLAVVADDDDGDVARSRGGAQPLQERHAV